VAQFGVEESKVSEVSQTKVSEVSQTKVSEMSQTPSELLLKLSNQARPPSGNSNSFVSD
jgi:hypothetical protein